MSIKTSKISSKITDGSKTESGKTKYPENEFLAFAGIG